MLTTASKVLVLLGLPVVLFLAAGCALKHFTGRDQFKPRADEAVPLGSRLGGYDSAAVCAYWHSLGKEGREAERRFLEADLAFPFVYGGLLLASLLIAWTWLGRPFNPGWLVLTVAITVVADWFENLVQWQQLKAYVKSYPVQDGWIQVASVATTTKLVFFGLSALVLIVLAVCLLARGLAVGK